MMHDKVVCYTSSIIALMVTGASSLARATNSDRTDAGIISHTTGVRLRATSSMILPSRLSSTGATSAANRLGSIRANTYTIHTYHYRMFIAALAVSFIMYLLDIN
jgi:hypothetical protein